MATFPSSNASLDTETASLFLKFASRLNHHNQSPIGSPHLASTSAAVPGTHTPSHSANRSHLPSPEPQSPDQPLLTEHTLTDQEREVFQFLHERFVLHQQQKQHQQALETEQTSYHALQDDTHMDDNLSEYNDELRQEYTFDDASTSSPSGFEPTLPKSSIVASQPVRTNSNTTLLSPTSPNGDVASFAAPKKYKCTLCPKDFERPSTLKTHMNSHTGNRPYSCRREGCEWKFTVLSNLKRHERRCGLGEYARRPNYGKGVGGGAGVRNQEYGQDEE
ncbi:hypothetical protein HDU98_010979 [Podochytrium sp. JEL0797]|nr:hypothetical protein HDU98_010979 [Podochytrium sp. JEL0797]